MKKVLLASTALVLSAGVAAADVVVGGDGRMGIIDQRFDVETPPSGDPTATVSDEGPIFTSRIRINFSASGETDGGLAFGGSVRADNYEDDQATNGDEGTVFIEGNFGRLSMGDVDGGAKAAVGHVSGVGLTGLGDVNEIIYVANVGPDTPGALYEYSFGDFGFFLSADNPTGGDDAWSIGVDYSGSNWAVGIGYEDTDAATVSVGDPDANFDIQTDAAATHFVAGGSATFGGFTGKLVIGVGEAEPFGTTLSLDIEQWALSGDYTFGATTLTAFYRDSSIQDFADIEGYGLGASYDLGGGAALVAGWSDLEITDVANNISDSEDAWDFGIEFSF